MGWPKAANSGRDPTASRLKGTELTDVEIEALHDSPTVTSLACRSAIELR
jgi:hypothetical protein